MPGANDDVKFDTNKFNCLWNLGTSVNSVTITTAFGQAPGFPLQTGSLYLFNDMRVTGDFSIDSINGIIDTSAQNPKMLQINPLGGASTVTWAGTTNVKAAVDFAAGTTTTFSGAGVKSFSNSVSVTGNVV